MEPAHVPVEGICVARVLTRPVVGIHKNQPVGKSALSTSCAQLIMHAPDVPHDLKVSKRLDSTPEIKYPPDSITLSSWRHVFCWRVSFMCAGIRLEGVELRLFHFILCLRTVIWKTTGMYS